MQQEGVFYLLNIAGGAAVPVLMVVIGWALVGSSGAGARMVVAGAGVHVLCWIIQLFAPAIPTPAALDAHQVHALWGAFFLIMVSAKGVFLWGVLLHVLRSRSSGIRREEIATRMGQQVT